MFEKIGRLAEAAANNVSVSRRGFLGRLGQGALGAIGVLAGSFVFSQNARSGTGGYYCCTFHCRNTPYRGNTTGKFCSYGGCPSTYFGCTVSGGKKVSDCTQC